MDVSEAKNGNYRLITNTDFDSCLGLSFDLGDGVELSLSGVTKNEFYSIDVEYGTLILTVTATAGTDSGLRWKSVSGADSYIVEYSADDFAHSIQIQVAGTSLSSLSLPEGVAQWRVRAENASAWMVGNEIQPADDPDAAVRIIQAAADGVSDIFFARADGIWESGFSAKHSGLVNGWAGTGEHVQIRGKNRFSDILAGSGDDNILYLTDDGNGDALFLEDIFSAFPDDLTECQARLVEIREIRAGAGNDLVDMTSRLFEYGSGMTIRGGAGKDIIWAGGGGSMLFGDSGNDRLVGASGDDVLAGGADNDSLAGGGGNDIFTFGIGWGNDTVEQLHGEADSVTLWFAETDPEAITAEDVAGNAVFTHQDGSRVTVNGWSTADITVRYNDGSVRYQELASAGAFMGETSENIFEEEGKGLLAAL